MQKNESRCRHYHKEVNNRTKAFENANNSSKEVNPIKKIATINDGLVGKTYPGTDILYKKHRFMLNGEKVEGVFPVFPSKVDVLLPKEWRNASDTDQFMYCTKMLARRIESDPELAKKFTPRQLEQIKNGAPRIAGLHGIIMRCLERCN